MKEQIKGSLILLLTATIWGIAFVAQSAGMDYIGAFTFNSIRSIMGGIVLIPVVLMLNKREKKNASEDKGKLKTLFIGGTACGVLLCIATNLQQLALKTAQVGKAGFLTALYIVLVPVVGLFMKRKVGKNVAVAVVLAVAGLYLLCLNGREFIPGKEDILLLLCALVFTFHILVIDYFAPKVNCVAMSCIQFFVCGILSAIPMLMFEEIRLQSVLDAAIPLLYAGVMSCGVAYTLQMVGQKNMNPTVASMILSLESVVSVLAGLIILNEVLSGREIAGCVLMFAAIILSQLPQKNKGDK